MSENAIPIAIAALLVAPRKTVSIYPEPFRSMMLGREKRALGDVFGLKNFGVNLTRLSPGGMSALRHAHTTQDEFVYVLEGTATLVTDAGPTILEPGMCAGFRAGNPDAHHLRNDSSKDVVYLEIGDRTPGDVAAWPDVDMELVEVDGQKRFVHRDGRPY